MEGANKLLPISVVLLIEKPEDYAELKTSAQALLDIGEVLIADSLCDPCAPASVAATYGYLPLPGLSALALKHRSALAASQPWVLFLHPGEQVSPIWFDRVEGIVRQPPSFTPCYAFPTKLTWHDITWGENPVYSDSWLVEREWFLAHPADPVQPIYLDTPLVRQLPTDKLTAWVDRTAERAAQKRLKDWGIPRLQKELFTAWLKETAGRGLMEGIFRGQLFGQREQRVHLAITLIQSHLEWLKLYAYTQSSTPVAGLLPGGRR